MISSPVSVETIAPLGHDEAMALAAGEWDRLLAVVDGLRDEDWSRPTDCTDWDVEVDARAHPRRARAPG